MDLHRTYVIFCSTTKVCSALQKTPETFHLSKLEAMNASNCVHFQTAEKKETT